MGSGAADRAAIGIADDGDAGAGAYLIHQRRETGIRHRRRSVVRLSLHRIGRIGPPVWSRAASGEIIDGVDVRPLDDWRLGHEKPELALQLLVRTGGLAGAAQIDAAARVLRDDEVRVARL